MSEAPPLRRIQAQGSQRDPQTMRFILEAPIQPGMTLDADGPRDGAPLAAALFALDGVRKVQVTGETILVTCAPGHDWQALKAPVAGAIRRVLDSTDQPLGTPAAEIRPGMLDAAMLARANEVLDKQANPSIAKHRGKVSAESVEDGVVYLRMSGGCHGCASSAITLRNGVERILRTALPEIREIVDVTDHATGENPFYQGAPGAAPTFTRPVPAEFIGWEEGKLTIDPEYLAPCIGLTPPQLQAGLASGDVTITTDTASGGRTRVVVRGALRAWAADVMADGSAREVPPPRQPTAGELAISSLPRRVRAHLEALAPEALPITYGRLARALGMYAPGSVRKVTSALEITMGEDAAVGRPFIAARVVSRGPAQSPGKGFFDLARRLGRGPQPGETDQAFHHRHMTASTPE